MPDINTSDINGIIVARLEGEIDLERSDNVRTVLLDCISRGRGVIADLSGVTMIDSSGVASFLEAFQKARQIGKTFVLAQPNARVMRVLKLASLEKVFVISDNVDKGIALAG